MIASYTTAIGADSAAKRKRGPRSKPTAAWHASPSEKNIQRAIVELLRMLNWVVVETSQRQAVIDAGLVGCPDVIAFRRGVTWLLEVKTERGVVRASQKEFAERIWHHVGPNLRYSLVRSIDDAMRECERDSDAGFVRVAR